jgi:hypothetical protein
VILLTGDQPDQANGNQQEIYPEQNELKTDELGKSSKKKQ